MRNKGQYGSYRKTSMRFQGKGGVVGTPPTKESLDAGGIKSSGGGGTIGKRPGSTRGKTAREYGKAFGKPKTQNIKWPGKLPTTPKHNSGFRERS